MEQITTECSFSGLGSIELLPHVVPVKFSRPSFSAERDCTRKEQGDLIGKWFTYFLPTLARRKWLDEALSVAGWRRMSME